MSNDKPGVRNTCAFERLVKLAAEVGGPIPPIDETFPLSKIKPNADTWYFSIAMSKMSAHQSDLSRLFQRQTRAQPVYR